MECDVAVIGSGPAGIQAAIHAARRKVSVVIIGKPQNSAMAGARIENYFGIPGAMNGDMILKNGVGQAKIFGCTVMEKNIIAASNVGEKFSLTTEDDEEIIAKAVIIATGISRKGLNVPGEKTLFGKGVSYCAVCDCGFYRGKTVVIVGDETEAAVSAELMTRYASKVYWVYRTIDASRNVVAKAENAGVKMINSGIKSIVGSDRVESVILENGDTIPTDGVFIELGAKSSADIATDLDVIPQMDDSIKVNDRCETDVAGVFACGDVTGKPWQVARAVGQGCVAGTSAAEYVKGVKE